MRFSLICSENIKNIIREIIISKGGKIENEGDFYLVEKGMEKNINKTIYTVFNPNNLDSLILFLDELNISNENKIKNLSEFITLKNKDKFELVSIEKVQFFESDNNDVYCILEKEKNLYKVKEKLYELEEKLDSNIFIRVSKSNIVNIMNVSEIVPWFSSKMLLKFKGSDRNIEVTRSYLKDFKKQLGI